MSWFNLRPSAGAVRLHTGRAGADEPTTDLYWTKDNVWNNGSETVYLKHAQGTLIHEHTYQPKVAHPCRSRAGAPGHRPLRTWRSPRPAPQLNRPCRAVACRCATRSGNGEAASEQSLIAIHRLNSIHRRKEQWTHCSWAWCLQS